ncbi:MAG: hypothetical protein EBR45_01515 [Betaproteobacteria bacterium]|nr:hypothetical protein [Betaproteobacteria bacterium]
MGWKDAPAVQQTAPAWQSAPVVASVKPKAKPAPKPAPRTWAGDLLGATQNTLGGLVKGAVGVPDAVTNAIGAAAGYLVQGGGHAAGYVADQVTGGPKLTNLITGKKTLGQQIRAGADYYARQLQHPVTIGGAVEAVAPTPKDSTGRTVRTISELAGGVVSPVNRFLPAAKAAPPSFPKAPPVTPSAVVAEGTKRGVRVMTSDVIPPKTIVGKAIRGLGEKIPLAGTSGPRAAQATERVAAVKNFVDEFGAGNPGALEKVTDNLIATRGNTIAKLTTAKNGIIERIPGNVPVDRTLTKIDEQIAKLNGINAKAYAPVVAKLQAFKSELAQGKTLPQIEGNRKLLGDLFADPSLAAIKTDGEKALNAIYAPLRAEMGTYIRNMGGSKALETWRKANTKLAAMAGELDNAALKGVLKTGEDTPENVAKLLFSAKKSDVARLYQNLSPVGRSRAQSAIIHRAMEKAQSIGPDGNAVISPERFVNEVSKLGQGVGVFFKGNDAQAVEGLTRLINATRQAGVANANPTTGAQVVPYAIGGAFTTLLGPLNGALAAGGTGLLARAYESAPVRDLLLKLAASPKGSKQEAAILTKIGVAISATGNRVKVATPINDNVAAAAVASDGKEQQQQQQ